MILSGRFVARLLANLGLAVAALLIMSGAAELGLRAFGFRPRAAIAPSSIASGSVGTSSGLESSHLKDAQVGWRNKPGDYLLNELGRNVRKRILPDGSRAARSGDAVRTGKAVLFVGDSFTAGAGLSDEETFAWKLQRLLPDWRILNFGVGGFGSCQVWAQLDGLFRSGILEGESVKGATVVYGFSDFHEGRTVAYPAWDYYLALRDEHQKSAYPYCRLAANGAAEILPPRRYRMKFPGATHSAFMAFLERGYLAFLTKPIMGDARLVTKRLLLQMNELVAAQHGRFVVLLMNAPQEFKTSYVDFFATNGIPVIDGSAQVLDPAMRLPDGHPNEAMNAIWSAQLAERLNADASAR